jgi:hypothetical protein
MNEQEPIVVEFIPNDQIKRNTQKNERKIKPPKSHLKKENSFQVNTEALSSRDFVEKYRKEAITASWDPKDLRKCGKEAKKILGNLAVSMKQEKTPLPIHLKKRKKEKEQQINSPRIKKKKKIIEKWKRFI